MEGARRAASPLRQPLRVCHLPKRGRILLGLTLLAACSQPAAEAPPGEKIACALDGATEFQAVCTVELVEGGIVLHRPDGGFRRLQANGARVEAADGADSVVVTDIPSTGGVEIMIGDDRYRTLLPAPTNAPAP